MRIRKSASRLLGSAYSAAAPAAPAPAPDASPPLELPPPPPHLAPCSAPEYCGGGGLASPATASGEHCELSRSPWDLIPEFSFSDPQVDDDLVDKYFVHIACRASWLFTTSMPTASAKKKEKPAVASAGEDNVQPRREVAKKVMKKLPTSKEKEKKKKKESEVKKKSKVKKEEGEDGGALVWKCKKNDGKRWHCHRTVSQPNSLCDYHFVQKRSYLNPEFEFASSAVASEAAPVSAAASKPSSTSKPRKKKSGGDFVATEGFYYYTGFGPSRTKRHCRSSGMNEPVSAKQELEEEHPEYASPTNQAQADDDTNRAADHDDVSMCDEDIAGIAGGDEESSDDDGIGTSVRTINGNGEPRASNDDSKRKTPWKRWRKPMKARSLKSLM